jgi:hypothetical protein
MNRLKTLKIWEDYPYKLTNHTDEAELRPTIRFYLSLKC